MAYEIPLLDLTFKSSGDMSTHQYKAVLASSANDDGGCTIVATRGGRFTGIYQDNSTAQTYGKVRAMGVSKVLAGDSSGGTAITQGAVVVASSQGCAVPSTGSGQYRLGIALESLGAGSTGVIPVLLMFGITT